MLFRSCNEILIHPLIESLSFITDPRRWGYLFRLGHFEIQEDDFQLIAKEMGFNNDDR